MTVWREVGLGEGLRVLHGYAFKGEFFSDRGEQIVLTPGNFIDAGGFKRKSGAEKYYTGRSRMRSCSGKAMSSSR